MTKQPRDKNGRFVRKKEKAYLSFYGAGLIFVLVMAGFAIGFITGDAMGHNHGYQTGLSDNQPTIYQNGFDAGATQQKNINELARNWTKCPWTYDGDTYCKNDNPDRVRIINSDYSTDFEYTMPDIWCLK